MHGQKTASATSYDDVKPLGFGRSTIVDILRTSYYSSIFRERPSGTIFGRIEKLVNTLSLTVFIQGNCLADFLQMKCDFRRKTAVLRSGVPLGAWA